MRISHRAVRFQKPIAASKDAALALCGQHIVIFDVRFEIKRKRRVVTTIRTVLTQMCDVCDELLSYMFRGSPEFVYISLSGAEMG